MGKRTPLSTDSLFTLVPVSDEERRAAARLVCACCDDPAPVLDALGLDPPPDAPERA